MLDFSSGSVYVRLCRLLVRMREYMCQKLVRLAPGGPDLKGRSGPLDSAHHEEAYEKADIDEEYPDDRRRRISRQGHDE